MKTLKELLEARAKALDELAALVAEGGEAYDAKEAELNKLEEAIKRHVALEARQKAALVPVDNPAGTPPAPGAPGNKGKVAPTVKEQTSGIGRFALSLMAAKGDPQRAAHFATQTWGDSAAELSKNLLSSVSSAGGVLVPLAFSEEMIELLRPASVVMAAGPRIIQMPNGNMTMPGVASGTTANYVGEAQAPNPSTMTFRGITLVAKKLISLIPVSNDMIRYVNASVEAFVRDDMIRNIAVTADQNLIRGIGSQFAPRGLRGWALEVAATNVLSANATVNLVNITNDLGRMELALYNANIPMARPTWMFSPRTKVYLENLRDGNGNIQFPEIARGQLRGKPFFMTTSIPDNLAADAGAATGSEIYLVEMNEFIIGESLGLELTVADGAAYFDGTGTVSGFSQDQTVMKALTAHDSAMRQARAVVLMENVRWIP